MLLRDEHTCSENDEFRLISEGLGSGTGVGARGGGVMSTVAIGDPSVKRWVGEPLLDDGSCEHEGRCEL